MNTNERGFNSGGIITLLLVLVAMVIVLSVLKIDIRELFGREEVRDNFGFIFEVFNIYVMPILRWIWDVLIVGFVWEKSLVPLADFIGFDLSF